MKIEQIIVSDKSFKSKDPQEILFSNSSVMNVLRTEGIGYESIHPDALKSYFVDFYLTQLKKGGFAQYVFTSRWYPTLIKYLESGLEAIGATKHLETFKERKAFIDQINEDELNGFLNSPPHLENPIKEKINTVNILSIEEDLISLNSNWLKNHPDLKVVPHESMYFEIEKAIGKTPNF